MRLDKFLCDNLELSRSEIKSEIKKGLVSVEGVIVKDPGLNVGENSQIDYNGNRVVYDYPRYYILNKPAGYITATTDKKEKTVMELIHEPNADRLSPVGRLDKDTEGLLLITEDGALAHTLVSPKSHVEKTYYVTMEHSLSDEDVQRLCEGVDIGDDKPTMPAKVNILDEKHIELTIVEGRFHQVKRMLEAVDNKVCYLKRIAFGELVLDDKLELGQYRKISLGDIVR